MRARGGLLSEPVAYANIDPNPDALVDSDADTDTDTDTDALTEGERVANADTDTDRRGFQRRIDQLRCRPALQPDDHQPGARLGAARRQ
jgi:hypothetical protein